MYLSVNDLKNLSRVKRLNIINSATGVKPANLLGTKSLNSHPNLAVFSNVVHLGSNPPIIGILFRPQQENPRDSYVNIKETGYFTLNQVPENMIQNAHYTSAKVPPQVSEFDEYGFTEEYLFGFHAPFVKESLLKIGLEMTEEIPVKSNNTILLAGKILHLQFPDEMMDDQGNLNLETIDAVGIGGVNTYYSLKKLQTFPYAHKDKPWKPS